jgi:sensor histidine kinase regulating citrate/malate metabolism
MSQYALNINNNTSNELEENHKDFIGFQVDGKIINELSNQVSSHLFAIGELMKNSYDAKATKIQISLNINENILTIEDNGDGIPQDNIQSLFHIAKSYKKYGV